MSLIVNNPILKGVSGMLANLIVFREVRGKIIIANRPKRSSTITPHQQEMKSRFLRAVNYAKGQMKNEQFKASYAKGINDRKHNAYTVALTDCMTPPEVKAIDVSRYNGVAGDLITIHATDDFKVVGVQVTLSNGAGEVIEHGEAVRPFEESDLWSYTTATNNSIVTGTKISVRATDKPGNETMKEMIIQ